MLFQDLAECRTIFLFGAGLGGKVLKTLLHDFLGLPVEGFLDNRKQGEHASLPILRPDDVPPPVMARATVVITAERGEDARRQVEALGCRRIIDAWPAIDRIIKDCCDSDAVNLAMSMAAGRTGLLLRGILGEMLFQPEQGLLDRVEERVDRSLVAHVPHMLSANFDYIRWNAPSALRFLDWTDHMRHALDAVRVDGMYLEFGVFSGRTINVIADHVPGRTIHGFDAFLGLPDSWYDNKAGYLSRDGRPPEVKANVELHIGWFDQTLPGFLAARPGPIAFLHVDCDVYRSTVEILTTAGDRIVPGTIIVFDEYWGYPGWREHEYKAFQEFCEQRKARYEYLCYFSQGSSVAVRILAVG